MNQVKLKKGDLLSEYKMLEHKVIAQLIQVILQSKVKSKHVDEKCIPVNVFDYTELSIINNDLAFLDKDGYHHSLYADCSIEDLIDIVNKL